MKKFLSSILALMLIVACMFTFAGCSLFGAKPELDLDTAADNLEDADYVVTYTDDEDEIGDPSVAEYLRASDDDDNYIYMRVYNDSKSAKLAYKELKLEFEMETEAQELRLDSYKNKLEKYEDELEDEEIDYIEDMIDELEEELEEMNDNFVYGRKGNTVWYGTMDALEASKG